MQHIEVERPVPFLRLPASGEIRLADVHDHLAALSIDTGVQLHLRPFIQVRLAREGLVTGYREELERIAEDFPVRLVEVRVQPSTVIASILGSEADPFSTLMDRTPAEMFKLAFKKKTGSEPSDAHIEIFRRIEAEVER